MKNEKKNPKDEIIHGKVKQPAPIADAELFRTPLNILFPLIPKYVIFDSEFDECELLILKSSVL
jgi:hypothetical protein